RQPGTGQSLSQREPKAVAARAFPQLQRRHAPRQHALGLRGARLPDGARCAAARARRLKSRMSYYAKHVFFCCNQRDGGRVCCNDKGAAEIRDYAKKRVKELGLSGEGKIRINQAGCLDRCEEGPCVVVYPDAVWYTYVDRSDIDEIIEEHLRHGRIVERLRM